ncbi:MAG: alpha/beta hydrolase domain-containing protein [Vicinamibacterales bacterium]
MARLLRPVGWSPLWFRAAGLSLAVMVCLVSAPLSAGAGVVKIVIDKANSQSPAYGGKSFGAIGPYEKLVGQVYGEIDPMDPHNRVITDLQFAPRNARGMVEYVASFALSRPVDISKASGVLIYEPVNRGRELIPNTFRSGDESGDEFFARRGDIIVRSGWQGDVSADLPGDWGGKAYAIQLPVAVNPDGSPITGPVIARFADVRTGTSTLALAAALPLTVLSYERPVSLDTRMSTLTTHASETMSGVIGGERTISSTDWSWADCTNTPFPGTPDPSKICLKDGVDPALLYQLVFTAKAPRIMGIGVASIRDLLVFFRHGERDQEGTLNPVAQRVSRVIAIGSSQTGRLVRTFIQLGFNEDTSGRIVWDGALENIAGLLNSVNVRFSIPGDNVGLYELRGEGVASWTAWPDPVRERAAAGVLDRCRVTSTCPKIFETNGATELWEMKGFPNLVGTAADRDIPLPDNVRRYYSPSTTHGGGDGGFSTESRPARNNLTGFGACALVANPNPEHETLRALAVALIDWVVKDTMPPESRYPRLATGDLVPPNRGAMGFPVIPGVPPPEAAVNPLLDYDLGPDFIYNEVSGVIGSQPPAIKHVLPGVVPRVNLDGNEIAGVPSVLLQVPLGTYTGWNVSTEGFFKGQSCGYQGGFIPFARTRAERVTSGDPRRSIEERYVSLDAYVALVRAAAARAVRERFLLQEDAERLVRQASASQVLFAR